MADRGMPFRLPGLLLVAHHSSFQLPSEMNLAKIVVVTGAGAGVGRATVEEFAKQGYDVALLSRDPDRLNKAAAEVRQHGVRALAIPTDVADAEAVEAAAEKFEIELGPIDVWVNVAMATVFAPLTQAHRPGGGARHQGHLPGSGARDDGGAAADADS